MHTLLALAEPHATAVLLAVFGLLMAFSVLFSRALDRVGIPVVLLFLALGMLGGTEGIGKLDFDNYEIAFRLGTIALVLILFDGGLNTSMRSIRRSIRPAGLLATVGVLGTAGVMATLGKALGLSWSEAALIGAIVSSTDAAAVFAVLRGGSLRVKDRVRSTLEVESCVNDPMAVILTITVVDVLTPGGPGLSPLTALIVPMQLIIGAAFGGLVGLGSRLILNRVTFTSAGLYPVATLSAAFVAFGAATVSLGSGILAVFVAGLVMGNGVLPYKASLTRVHDAIAWLGQVSLFLMLGLLVYPSQLIPVAGIGLLLGLALAFLARPMVVWLCLTPFGWSLREMTYVCWVGIRGAVPIVLATFPVMAGIPDAERIFNIVFFIVALSTIIPGATIVRFTRILRLIEPGPPNPAAALEMHSLRPMNGVVTVYHIDASVAVCGASLADVSFPEHAAVILIVRGDSLVAARGNTRLEEGDHAYIFCRPDDEPTIGLLFGRPLDN
ncbi:MAG: potassium/proton antiporter [Phycisphaerales bacterium]